MRIVKNLSWFLYKILAVYSVAVMILIYQAVSAHWIAGFMMMSFPVVIILNILFLFIFLFSDRKRAISPAVVLIISLIFLPRSFGFAEKTEIGSGMQKSFTIMNYNVHEFNAYSNQKSDKEFADGEVKNMVSWITNADADIICMAEYRTSKNLPVLNVNSTLLNKGYKFSRFLENDRSGTNHNYRGMALFSKYPIIASKQKSFEYLNGMLQADVKIDRDTVRVIAVHLYSMTLQLSKLVGQRKADGVKKEGRIVFSRIKNGFIGHATEFKELEAWIKSSPYPVLVCGDFNETPYGYVYGKTRDMLTNAFEEKGRGFGFTYNHLPYFIRIDHQFYDAKKLGLLTFETIDSVKYSDHYPLIGTYQIK